LCTKIFAPPNGWIETTLNTASIEGLINFGAKLRYNKGLNIAKSVTDDLYVAAFNKELALLAASQGRLMEAKDGLESVITILKEHNEMFLISTMAELGEVNRKLKNYDAAFIICNDALKLAKKLKRRDSIAWISRTLAFTEAARSNYQSALSFAFHAVEFFEKPGLYVRRVEELKALIGNIQEKLTK